jgi:hypothetical protein
VDFLDEKRAIIRNATYTTCQRRPGRHAPCNNQATPRSTPASR